MRVSVFAAARSTIMEPGGRVLTEGGDPGQRVYYPGGLKAERGEPVVLHAGDERLDVDFVTSARIPIGTRVAEPPRDATAVSGRIVSSSGRPLSGARVALAPTGSTDAPQRQTVSDEAGAYQFVLPAKASGTFRIVATRVGYVSGWYGQHDERDVPEEIAVVAGDQIMDRNVTLAPTSTIIGRIFDERGDAIEGAAIRASTIRFIDGQRRLVRAPVATAYTDDVGGIALRASGRRLHRVSGRGKSSGQRSPPTSRAMRPRIIGHTESGRGPPVSVGRSRRSLAHVFPGPH